MRQYASTTPAQTSVLLWKIINIFVTRHLSGTAVNLRSSSVKNIANTKNIEVLFILCLLLKEQQGDRNLPRHKNFTAYDEGANFRFLIVAQGSQRLKLRVTSRWEWHRSQPQNYITFKQKSPLDAVEMKWTTNCICSETTSAVCFSLQWKILVSTVSITFEQPLLVKAGLYHRQKVANITCLACRNSTFCVLHVQFGSLKRRRSARIY
jgi:hypothetical protein